MLSPAAGSTVRRYVSLNTNSRLTYFLERSGHIGHGYESPEACGDGMLLVPPEKGLHFSAVRAEECGLFEFDVKDKS